MAFGFILIILGILWALISLSLFNAILLIWLGLTVFLSAERRSTGLWLVLIGMLIGAVFFISHTFILVGELHAIQASILNFWWHVGWMPVILSPLLWYVMILWYAGYFSHPPLRHRIGLGGLCTWAAVLVGYLIFSQPIPRYEHIIVLDFSETVRVFDVPMFVMLYPPYTILCILLPIDVLMRPAPSQRMMGEEARQRSRPWLIRASVMLLVVAVLVSLFLVWMYLVSFLIHDFRGNFSVSQALIAFDLLLTTAIGAAIVLLGQAVVSYEVFTGKSLPRRGFFRHWRNAIILSAGVAGFIGWCWIFKPSMVYSLTAMAILTVTFYALLSWRSFVHRDALMARLRPFVTSQGLMEHLINPNDDSHSRAKQLFDLICHDMLNTQQACLVPLGVLAPLVGSPLTYPTNRPPLSPPALNGEAELALDPKQYDGFVWAVPLWSERGLIGALMLGRKQDDALYTQEEIDMARVSAERIVDMVAGEQMARRLMGLQRERHKQTQVLDLSTRRTLHDEILPTLHLAVLQASRLSRDDVTVQALIKALTEAHGQISDLIHSVSKTTPVVRGNGNLQTVLVRMIEEEFEGAFQEVTWHIDEKLPALDELTLEVVSHAVREALRNAAVHGRGESSERRLGVTIDLRCDAGLVVEVVDDGVGYAPRERKSTDSGSGGGLALHSTMLAIVGGYLTVERGEAGGTRVTISLPA